MIDTRIVLPTVARVGLPGVLEIASGTRFATTVRDVREMGPWATPGKPHKEGDPRVIFYHHTASALPVGNRWGAVAEWLAVGRREWPFGVPYNFIVMPRHGFPIYYLHDVDYAWPHTYGYNHATAIAAVGDYDAHEPPAGMVTRMLRLADALATMWGERVPEWQHRDVFATACPGRYLSPLLPQWGRQRD